MCGALLGPAKHVDTPVARRILIVRDTRLEEVVVVGVSLFGRHGAMPGASDHAIPLRWDRR